MHLGGSHKLVGRSFLQQHAGNDEKIVGVLGHLIRENTHCTKSGRYAKLLVIVSLPLPLLAYRRTVKLVTLNRIGYWILVIGYWLLIRCHGFAFLTHHRPASRPVHRVQVYHATVCLLVLEVQEPVLTIFRMHPTTLVGAIDIGLTLLQHDLVLIGTVGRP